MYYSLIRKLSFKMVSFNLSVGQVRDLITSGAFPADKRAPRIGQVASSEGANGNLIQRSAASTREAGGRQEGYSIRKTGRFNNPQETHNKDYRIELIVPLSSLLSLCLFVCLGKSSSSPSQKFTGVGSNGSLAEKARSTLYSVVLLIAPTAPLIATLFIVIVPT